MKRSYRKDNVLLEITQEINPTDPREWDNLGVMVCFHRRYKLGDEHGLKTSDFNGWDEIEAHIYDELNAAIVLPLYLYDHSGLRMKIGSFAGLLPQGHARFDSGQVGFIYAPKEALKDWPKEHKEKHFPNLTDTQIIEKILRSEIETYDTYLRGDIWRFTLYTIKKCDLGHEHKEHEDSCGGFYGQKIEDNGLLEHAEIDDIEEWTEIRDG